MSIKLSEGAIQTILSGGSVDTPILQVLGHKKMSGQGQDRYRLLISDGIHSNSHAMAATQIINNLDDGDLSEYSVVKVLRHVVSTLNGGTPNEKRVIVILELEVLKKGSEVNIRIGNPVQYGTGAPAPAPQPAAPQSNGSARAPARQPSMNSYGGPVRAAASPAPGPNTTIHPISSLNPYQNRWCIKAKVTNKPPMRTYKNARGEGKLFNVTFADESGEIKCTGFNETAERFYNLLEVGKAYLVSNCQLKVANKQYTNAEYEMSFHNDSQVVPCADDDIKIAGPIFNFLPIQKISDAAVNTPVDVIGVIQQVGECGTLMARNTGKELKKREVTIVDQSNVAVALTLWDTLAVDFSGNPGDVVAAKAVSVNEFMGGKSVSTRMNSMVQLNPDIPEAHRMRGWYDNGGAAGDIQSISAKSGGPQGGSGNWIMMDEARGLGMGDRPDYFTSAVRVIMPKSENCFYRACPGDNCKKKVTDMNNGRYRCEKCNREYDNFLYRLLLSMNVSDSTGSQWVTLFHEEAEKVLKVNGQVLGEMIDNKDEAYKTYFNELSFKAFQMKFRVKMESYNDESRLKFNVASIEPFEPKSYARRLLNEFKEDVGIGKVNGS